MRILLLLTTLLSGLSLFGQTDTTLTGPTATVTAYLRSVPVQQAPISLAVLDQRALAGRELALTPTAALNRLPGVTMQSGALGTHRIVLRGQGARAPFTSNRVRAYFGAIPLTDGEGNTDLEDLDLQTVHRVSVLRGPAASAFGSGLGGVIRFDPDLPQARGTGGTVDAAVGSFGTYQFGAQLRHNTQADVSDSTHQRVLLAYRRVEQDGFRQNSRYRRDNLTAHWRVRSQAGATTTLQALWTGVRGEIPSSLGATALAEDATQAGGTWGAARGFESYDRLAVGATHKREVSDHLQLVTSAFAKTRRAYEPRPFNILRENTTAIGGRAVANYTLATDGALAHTVISAGGEVLREWYDWQTYENRFRDFPEGTGSVQGTQLLSFAERRTRLDGFLELKQGLLPQLYGNPGDYRLLLTAGLGTNRTEYMLDDLARTDSLDLSGSYRYPTQVSPRVALQFNVSDGVLLEGSVSRGFAPPSVAETLTPEGALNASILPEHGWNYEFGVRYGDVTGGLQVEAVGYALLSDNMLVARRTAQDEFVGVNAGEARQLGLETSARYQFGDARVQPAYQTSIAGEVYASYTYQHHRFGDFVEEGASFTGNKITGVPSHSYALGVDAHYRKWQAHLGARGRGELPVNDANDTYAEAFTVLSAQVSYAVLEKLTLSLGGDNLFDADFVPMVSVNAGAFGAREPRYFYPGTPRSAWVRMRWAFGVQ